MNHSMTCRKRIDDVKTGMSRWPGISSMAACLLIEWHPALRWRELATGIFRERGNLSPRCQGRSSSGDPTRARVPMCGTGTDRLVVAEKVANVTGAKGSNHPAANIGQPAMGGAYELSKTV